jgi:archaemetzincin
MIRNFYFTIIFTSLVYSCNNKKTESIQSSYKTIDIQPFNGISNDQTTFVLNEINKVYPHVLLNNSIALPKLAFYRERNRYRADSLIHFLNNRTNEDHITIGLTNQDISTTNNSIKDWGIMGLGYCPGKACIASTFRLSKDEQKMQLFKVAIHELGHTQGLPHCSVKTCFMRDAEGRNPTNEENAFCPKCKKYLIEKGWRFN